MELKHKLEQIFNNNYPGTDRFIADVIEPIFGNEIEYINDDLAERKEYTEKAKKAGIKHIKYIGDLTEKNYNADNIALLDVTLDDSKNIERSRVSIQQLIRSIMDYRQHLMIVFHYEDVKDKQWRFSYAYKGDSLKDSTSAKRYTYVFGKGYRGRTAAERFEILAKSSHNNEDFEKAFSVAALSDEFFDKYRDIYADFVQYITGKRYEKIKNKWKEVKKGDPNTEIFSQFNNDDKRVRDYIKKMLGRLTFLCFLQRKDWMNNDRNFLQNLYQTSPQQDDFLDAVMEPLFFGVLNTPPEKREEVFIKNRWNTELADEWGDIPYLNGGLFEQTRDDKLTVKFPKKLFQELFKFLGEYNFTIDENDPDDAEVGIDPEMLGRVFESLLEDNKDKGAFYTPKEIVQYMCRQSIIEYLKTHTDQSLHADIEDLINKGLVNNALQNKDNARNLYKFLKEVTVCDPAIGSGAFPMSILNILFTARQHLYGFLKESEPFNPLEVKKSIIRDNIYGVDIEQGAVDIARLRFWLAILVEEQVATPLPNLDYRIVRGNSLITTFNDEYIQLPENPDGRTKLAKLKKELNQLQNDLFDLNGDEKLQREIEIKCKILEIIKVQLGIDKANAQEESRIESNIFEKKDLTEKALKKARQARAIEEVKSKSLFALNNLITSLTTPATSLADRAQIDIKFFDWKIIFSNIFSEDNTSMGFDIVIGNPPYIKEYTNREAFNGFRETSPYYQGKMDLWYGFACHGLDLLKDNGILSFIATSNWVSSSGASKLRAKVRKDANLKFFIDFGTYMIFGDSASIQTMVMFIIRDDDGINFSTKHSKNLIDKSSLSDIVKLLNGEADHASYGVNIFNRNESHKIFSFGENAVNSICAKMAENALYLEEKNIAQGIIGAPDDAFVISDPTKFSPEEQQYIKPYYTGLKNKYCLTDTDRFIIYLSAQNFSESKFLESKGFILHFEPFKTKLIESKIKFKTPKKPYYYLHRERKEIFFKRGIPRLITQGRALAPTFVYTENDCYPSRALFVITSNRFNLKFLCAILNSKLIKYWLKNKGKMQGACFQIDKGPLLSIPIQYKLKYEFVLINYINQIFMPNGNCLYNCELAIDHIVYHLYNLTYDEVQIVDPETPISREEYESFNIDRI